MGVSESPTTSTSPAFIGRNEIVCVLGEGGMARVFLAVQRGAFDVSKLVVVKQLRPEFASDQEFLAMFVDEARISLRFNHPNVVHTYEVSAEVGEYCLIMEYLEGRTLAQLLRRIGRERMPLDAHVWILSQVLAGLHYAHGLVDFDGTPLGVVHRDVSPTNVLVTSSGEVKLLDFGIVKAVGAISFTRQGVVKGKLGYASPEQCMGRSTDARGDVYAVGVMLWEAIAGRRRSSSAESQLAALRARIDNVEPPVEDVVPDVAPELAQVCRMALAHDPDRRWPSALDFQNALQGYLARSQSQNLQAVVADLVRSQFAQDLVQERQAIEVRMSSSVRNVTGAFATRSVLPSSAQRNTPARIGAPSSAAPAAYTAPGGTGSVETDVLPHDFAPRRRRWALIGGAGATAAIAVFALGRTGSEPPVEQSTAAAKPAPSLAAEPTAEPPRPMRVGVSIRVSPERATLRLDGVEIANPYNTSVASDGREREVVAALPGYAPAVRRVRFDRDVDLLITLERSTSGRTAPEPVRRSAAHARKAVSESAAPASAAPSESRAAQSSNDGLEPGADLRKSQPARPRAIDEEDPYSK